MLEQHSKEGTLPGFTAQNSLIDSYDVSSFLKGSSFRLIHHS